MASHEDTFDQIHFNMRFTLLAVSLTLAVADNLVCPLPDAPSSICSNAPDPTSIVAAVLNGFCQHRSTGRG